MYLNFKKYSVGYSEFMGAGLIGASLLALSGCGLSTGSTPVVMTGSATSPTSTNVSPPSGRDGSTVATTTEHPALSVKLNYGDDHEETIDFVMDERKPIFRNPKPIILPSSMPESMKIALPSTDWKNLNVGAFALFGQEVRELKATGSAESKNTDLNINVNELSLSGFREAFPQGPGFEGEISLNITSTVGTVQTTRAIEISFRTPPKAPHFEESPLLNLSQVMAISPNTAVIPLRFYKMTNTTQYDWSVEMPYQPAGQMVHQVRRKTYQQGNCSVTQGSGMERAEYTHQFLLVPEGTAQSQMIKILSEQGDKVSQLKLPSKGSLGYVLYAVTSPTALDPRAMGRNWTGSAKMISPACGPGACSKKAGTWRQLSMNGDCSALWMPIKGTRDGYYCVYPFETTCDRSGNCDLQGHRSQDVNLTYCKENFIDPIAAVPYNDYTEILGNALLSPDLTNTGRVYFDGLTLNYPDQASPLEKVQSQVSLWGSFNFSQ